MSMTATKLPPPTREQPKTSPWRWGTIGETGRYINGVAFRPSDWTGEGLPIIRIQNLTDSSKPLNRTRRKVDDIYQVEPGDLLVSWSATLDAFIWDREPALLNQHIFKVVPNSSVVTKRFLFYLLRLAIADMIKSEHLHGSTMKHINRGPFLAHSVPIPPLEEQRRIVAEIEKQFTRLDAGVASLERVQTALKRYRASVLKAAGEGRLVLTEAELARKENRSYETGEQLLQRIRNQRRTRYQGGRRYREPSPPDDLPLSQIPEGWTFATAEQLSDPSRTITYGVIKLGPNTSDGISVLRSSDVRHLRIDLHGVKQISPSIAANFGRTLLHGEEVVLTVRGTLGGVAVVPRNCEGFNISREVAMIALVEPKLANFVATMIASSPLQHWLLRRAKGIAYTGINIETLKQLPIPIPPLTEQQRIVIEVERRLSITNEVGAAVLDQLRRVKPFRRALLERAFSSHL